MRSGFWALASLATHWRRRPVQLLAMIAGLSAATALWSGVQALNAEARASYAQAAQTLTAQSDALVSADGGPIPQETYIAMRRAGWQVSPVIEGVVLLGGRPVNVTGVDVLTLPRGGLGPAAGDSAGAGDGETESDADLSAFLSPGHTWMAPETMRALGLSEGDAAQADGGATLPPAQARPGMAPGTAMLDVGAAQSALGMQGQVTQLLIAGPNSLGAPRLENLAPELRRVAPDENDDLERLTASFHLNLTAFGLLAFVVGLFIVYSAAGLAFEQRLSMMRTMRACGVSRRTLAGALLAELTLLALIAGMIGVALGYAIASMLLPGVAITLSGLYGAPAPGSLSIRPEWWASGLAMSLLGALAALGASLARAWRLPVLAPAQPVAWMMAQRKWMRLQAAASVLLLAACAMLLMFGDGLAMGFAAMATLLLGAALALPPCLSALLRAGQRAARTSIAEWFWADARREMSGLSLALMALLLALGANIGVGSMVGGFRNVFTEWLDQRLAADLYLNIFQPEQMEEAARFLRARVDVVSALPIARAEAQIEAWPIEVEGFSDDPMYRATWPLTSADADWDAVARGEAALISEQLAQHFDLSPGDTLTLPAPAGDWALQVAGVYADYGNPRGQVRVEIGAMLQRWPEARPSSLEIVTRPGATQDVMAALRAQFGSTLGPMMEQDSVKRLSLTIFDRTFAVTAALNVLTLGVAGAALLASLAALAEQRLPQLAPLWALGVRRKRLAQMELGKTLALAALTAVLAIPLGVALAWLLVAVINVEAFGWRLPLHVFPLQWLMLFALALLAALLAGAGPALRLARTRPAALAKVFANER